MKKSVILFYLLMFRALGGNAQFNETIRTGRPGQAIGPFAVGVRVFQMQTGVDIGGFNEKKAKRIGNSIAPNTVLRFGVTGRLEINAAYEYRYDRFAIKDSAFAMNGLSLGSIGSRINLYEGKKQIPAVGLQLTFKLPILSAAYRSSRIAPTILLIASERLDDKFSLLLNFGLSYDCNNAQPATVYVANLAYSISSEWGTYVENYGSFSNNIFEHRWDTGLAYLLNNNLQFDIYGGAGYNNGKIDYFTSIGVSWRTVTGKKSANTPKTS